MWDCVKYCYAGRCCIFAVWWQLLGQCLPACLPSFFLCLHHFCLCIIIVQNLIKSTQEFVFYVKKKKKSKYFPSSLCRNQHCPTWVVSQEFFWFPHKWSVHLPNVLFCPKAGTRVFEKSCSMNSPRPADSQAVKATQVVFKSFSANPFLLFPVWGWMEAAWQIWITNQSPH